MAFSAGTKNGQKSAKIGKQYKKNRFSLQQLPKKAHFLKEMHQKINKIAFGKKKVKFFSPLRRDTAATPRAIPISGLCDSVILPLYLNLPKIGPKLVQNRPKKSRGAPKNPNESQKYRKMAKKRSHSAI